MFDWAYLRSASPELLHGLRITLEATLAGMAIALVFGLILACVQVMHIPVARQIAVAWIFLIRSTPLLVQLLFLFYVLPNYGVLLDALTLGIIGLGAHFSCYTAEAYRGGFLSVPKGQWEAARVLNLPRMTTLWSVILPQAVRPVVPVLGNSFISMFKDSSVLSAITILDLLGESQRMASTSFQYTTLFSAMGLIYLLLAYPASLGVRAIERRMAKGVRAG